MPPIDNTFTINIGDMLEVWTRSIFISTPHRVKNKAKGNRQSIPYFMEPNWLSTMERIPEELFRKVDLEMS